MLAVARNHPKTRILVVDDDGQLRALLRRMLERDGYEVTEAADGAAGVRAFAARRVDLAVVDLFMPDKTGWETIRALEALAPGLPFIVVSGGGALEALRKGSTGTLEAMRGLAPFRVLRKPFEWQELRTAVTALLSDSGAGEPS